MKTITLTTILILGIVSRCLGASDAVSSITKGENEETTTFRRDGKVILKIILYHSTEPKRKTLRQTVFVNDNVVMELVEFQGKRLFHVRPDSNVSVCIQQDSSTGVVGAVILTDDSEGVMDIFDVKDSRLTPVSGKVLELIKKHTMEGSGNQEGRDNGDKPSQHNPSPPKNQ